MSYTINNTFTIRQQFVIHQFDNIESFLQNMINKKTPISFAISFNNTNEFLDIFSQCSCCSNKICLQYDDITKSINIFTCGNERMASFKSTLNSDSFTVIHDGHIKFDTDGGTVEHTCFTASGHIIDIRHLGSIIAGNIKIDRSLILYFKQARDSKTSVMVDITAKQDNTNRVLLEITEN